METKTCQNCSQQFTIEPDDFGFYEKIGVPPPTWCPDCRYQRRLAWRNNLSFYSRKCELCSNPVVTLYSPESKIVVYCNKCWWSDKWDQKSYAMEYDFSKSFFEQFNELMHKVPHLATVNDNGIASVNCEYSHDCWFAKNCYMTFFAWKVENVLYSTYMVGGTKDAVDCLNILEQSNWLYECITCHESHRLKYSEHSRACSDSAFLYDCRDCSNCFMSAGLRHKKYYFKNKQYSKEEYERIIAEYRLDTFEGVERAQKEFDEFILSQPRRFAYIFKSVDCTGDLLFNGKNSKYCYNIARPENCRFYDNGDAPKDCYDLSTSGELSECYDGITVDHSSRNFFGVFSVKSQDLQYTQHCHSSKHLLGCVSLRNEEYCILNKKYTKEEYETLAKRIREQMMQVPYIDKNGKEYRFGEFYPAELSPFGYNETVAQEQFLLKKDEALLKKFNWQDNIQRTVGKETLPPEKMPDSIHDTQDTIQQEILSCIDCKRNYRIIPSELSFYRQMHIPIPRRCFHCRHALRIKRRNPFALWHRKCSCAGNTSENNVFKNTVEHFHGANPCPNEFETTYAPERKEIVYCEQCYNAEIA